MSGLIQTQVMALLKDIKRQAPDIDLTLIAFWQPWVYRKHKYLIDQMSSDLSCSKIDMESYPWAIIPSRYFLYNKFLFPILHKCISLMFTKVQLGRFDIVHCRSYIGSLISSELKNKFGYKCIFDMRSLFPKENVTAGKWTLKDKTYKMWLKLEKYIVKSSDATIGVTQSMVDEIRSIEPKANGVLIPICVDTSKFYFDDVARIEIRKKNGWDHRFVVAYEGSIGSSNSWNNIHNYAKYFSFILKIRPDALFLILTQSNKNKIVDVLSKYEISSSQYKILEAGPGKLHEWLSAADIGINVMSTGPDSHTRLGVKIVEYISCGLPIIINSNVGGALDLVYKYNVGFVLDIDNNIKDNYSVFNFHNQSMSIRSRCRKVSEDLFSVEICARKYIDLYNDLTKIHYSNISTE